MLTNFIVHTIRPHLRHDDDGSCYEREQQIFDVMERKFAELGVEIITDYDREQLGLPARCADGWTLEEMLALERRRLEAIMKPLSIPIIPILDK
jgi:hypothetical protein